MVAEGCVGRVGGGLEGLDGVLVSDGGVCGRYRGEGGMNDIE